MNPSASLPPQLNLSHSPPVSLFFDSTKPQPLSAISVSTSISVTATSCEEVREEKKKKAERGERERRETQKKWTEKRIKEIVWIGAKK